MENKIQFYKIQKNGISRLGCYDKNIIHVLTLPGKICWKFMKDVDFGRKLQDDFELKKLIFPEKNLWLLDYEILNRIWNYLTVVNNETIGKYYEDKDCHYKIEESMERMYKAFESYTGLNRMECTDEFRESVMEFLNSDSGSIFFILEDMYRNECDSYVFMKILDC